MSHGGEARGREGERTVDDVNARTIGIGLVALLLTAAVALVALTSGSSRESGAGPRSDAADTALPDTTGAALVPAQLTELSATGPSAAA